ncbi:putative transmembrane protein [Toxoplasma gondii RUB]|uniref:Putative transmembrane protein n=1 Tax=Toxoplasma gondii RUB TaxID=935652 RepID=A0A086M8E2_TOXGO|nr:putative transmembrane protein [Toxoplasma gondii RUB]
MFFTFFKHLFFFVASGVISFLCSFFSLFFLLLRCLLLFASFYSLSQLFLSLCSRALLLSVQISACFPSLTLPLLLFQVLPLLLSRRLLSPLLPSGFSSLFLALCMPRHLPLPQVRLPPFYVARRLGAVLRREVASSSIWTDEMHEILTALDAHIPPFRSRGTDVLKK